MRVDNATLYGMKLGSERIYDNKEPKLTRAGEPISEGDQIDGSQVLSREGNKRQATADHSDKLIYDPTKLLTGQIRLFGHTFQFGMITAESDGHPETKTHCNGDQCTDVTERRAERHEKNGTHKELIYRETKSRPAEKERGKGGYIPE